MAQKRSPSPGADEHNPSTTKQPRVDSEAAPLVDPSSPTGSTTVPARPPAPTDEAEQSSEGTAAEVKKQEDKQEGQDEERRPVEEDEEDQEEGIKVTDIDSIRVSYEKHDLQGFPDAQDIVYPHKGELNDKLFLWRGDITLLAVDCIVNAAKKSLLGGGGVDGAIHRAAGSALYHECKTLDGAETGETKLTGGHRLPSKHIAHTVGPIYHRGKEAECEEQLRSCYRGTLQLCAQNGLRTVAFSGISTGVYGYPLDDAASVACDEVRKFLEGTDGDKIDAVIFTVFRQIDVNPYLDNLPAYFPPPPSSEQSNPAAEADSAAPATAEKAVETGTEKTQGSEKAAASEAEK
ncbi:hypothetical protein JCM11641_003576 [Rhodosporidiobolus odoratus]